VEVVASLSQGRTAAAQCGLFTYTSVPVIFEPPCKSSLDKTHTAYFRSAKWLPLSVDSRNTLLVLWKQPFAGGIMHLRKETETCRITRMPYTVYCTVIIPSTQRWIKDGGGGSGVLVPGLP